MLHCDSTKDFNDYRFLSNSNILVSLVKVLSFLPAFKERLDTYSLSFNSLFIVATSSFSFLSCLRPAIWNSAIILYCNKTPTTKYEIFNLGCMTMASNLFRKLEHQSLTWNRLDSYRGPVAVTN